MLCRTKSVLHSLHRHYFAAAIVSTNMTKQVNSMPLSSLPNKGVFVNALL